MNDNAPIPSDLIIRPLLTGPEILSHYIIKGPIVGYLVYSIFLALTGAGKVALIGIMFFPIAIPITFILGAPPAFIAGLYAVIFMGSGEYKMLPYLGYITTTFLATAAAAFSIDYRNNFSDPSTIDTHLYYVLTSMITAMIMYMLMRRRMCAVIVDKSNSIESSAP